MLDAHLDCHSHGSICICSASCLMNADAAWVNLGCVLQILGMRVWRPAVLALLATVTALTMAQVGAWLCRLRVMVVWLGLLSGCIATPL